MKTQLPPPSTHPGRAPISVWIALILLTATIIAGAAGWLAYAGGTKLPTAILTGGGAFAGTVLLLIALHQYSRNGE